MAKNNLIIINFTIHLMPNHKVFWRQMVILTRKFPNLELHCNYLVYKTGSNPAKIFLSQNFYQVFFMKI